MKSFLEEYGVVVVSAIIIMIFVVLAPMLGKTIGKGTETTVTMLTSKLNENPKPETGPEVKPEEQKKLEGSINISNLGKTYTANVTGVQKDAQLTYQWYIRDYMEESFTKVEDAIMQSYTIPSIGSYYIYCIVTDSSGKYNGQLKSDIIQAGDHVGGMN